MNYLKSFFIGFLPILLTIIGALAIIVGKLDDAPGSVLIGLVIIGVATVLNIKLTTYKL